MEVEVEVVVEVEVDGDVDVDVDVDVDAASRIHSVFGALIKSLPRSWSICILNDLGRNVSQNHDSGRRFVPKWN